jgi:hypothetical protein
MDCLKVWQYNLKRTTMHVLFMRLNKSSNRKGIKNTTKQDNKTSLTSQSTVLG